MAATAKPIVWIETRFGMKIGRVGGRALFSIMKSTKRGDHRVILSTSLPDHGLNYYADSEIKAMQMAGTMMREFIAEATE